MKDCKFLDVSLGSNFCSFLRKSHLYRKSVKKMINCYNSLFPDANIFLATNAKAVKWADWSVIEADLICMEQLLRLESQ